MGVEEEDSRTLEEIERAREAQDAKSRATVLEMVFLGFARFLPSLNPLQVGDIPDVDFAPPEHILFVCKLHPATQEEVIHVLIAAWWCCFG